ncbi:terminase large subunit domain-containing protein [Nannocystis pusilla]|uniref:terminase large subunit domain-containing protein n=1 Tax=Nannocystis pusilla TaxID=889268 RepID=UPI003DA6C21A
MHDYAPVVRDALERAEAGEVVGDTPNAPPCPCCGSRTAAIVDTIPDVELLIDRETGIRVRREHMPPDVWDEIAVEAELVDVPLRVGAGQVDLLRSEDRNIFATGGNRSGKTLTGLVWLARQWLLHGGRERRFWLIGPKIDDAFNVWKKLFTGDAPVLPLDLAVRYPATAASRNLETVMVDGSIIDLKHMQQPDGGNLKSHPIVAGLCDEAAHMPSEDCYVALMGRTLDLKGRLWFASTARPAHFLKAKIIDPCLVPSTAEHKHIARVWTTRSLSLFTNPWLDPIDTARKVGSMGREDPSVRRDVFGEWVSNQGPLWMEFDQTKHVIRNECRALEEWAEWARHDITPTVARRIFGQVNPHYRGLRASNHRYIGGMDVNKHPLSTVVLQVACDSSDPTNRDKWTVFVWDIIYTKHGNALKQADALGSHSFARVRRAAAAGSELAGIGIVTDATAVTRDPTSHSYAGDPRGLAELFGKAGYDVRPPEYSHNHRPVNPAVADTYRLIHRLFREGRLFVHERCVPLIESLLEQEDSGDGTTPIKVSHTRSDILSSPVDALRYACWAIFYRPEVKAPTLVSGW